MYRREDRVGCITTLLNLYCKVCESWSLYINKLKLFIRYNYQDLMCRGWFLLRRERRIKTLVEALAMIVLGSS